MNHRQETTAVKQALKAASIHYRRVGHGTGTAWTWMHIYLGPSTTPAQEKLALTMAQAATGRSGAYDGQINVYHS